MTTSRPLESARAEVAGALPAEGDGRAALAADAVDSTLVARSGVPAERLRDIATAYLTEVLPGHDDPASVARTCLRADLRAETLSTLLADLQVAVLEAAADRDGVSTHQVVRVVGRDVAEIADAFARVRAEDGTSGGSGQAAGDGTSGGSGRADFVASAVLADLHGEVRAVTTRSSEIESLTEQQSDNIEELSHEVGEVSAAVEEVAAAADEVDAESDEAASLATDGHERASDLQERVDEMYAAATRVDDAMATLADRIDEIDGFVDAITEIADQTNMLALNASIEAARVDGGEGFAVVAEEVKSLAEDSQAEAERIRGLVETIDDATARVTDDVQEVSGQIEATRGEVDTALDTFEQIDAVTARLSTSVADVATAADQQAESTEELALMAEEANRKANMILEEVHGIDEKNNALLARLEAAVDDVEAGSR